MEKPRRSKHDSMTIHDLPVADRPRERLQRLGVEALSAQEILALILGRGIAGESVIVTAQRLLSQFGGLKGIAGASLEELAQGKIQQLAQRYGDPNSKRVFSSVDDLLALYLVRHMTDTEGQRQCLQSH